MSASQQQQRSQQEAPAQDIRVSEPRKRSQKKRFTWSILAHGSGNDSDRSELLSDELSSSTSDEETGFELVSRQESGISMSKSVPITAADKKQKRSRTPEEMNLETSYALVSTHRNLNRMSQYLLKLEVRANLVTPQDIRETVDATIADSHKMISPTSPPSSSSSSSTPPRNPAPPLDQEQRSLIEEINTLSANVWDRLFTLDTNMRRLSRATRAETSTGKSVPILMQGESHTKAWIDNELAQLDDIPSDMYYTVQDLAEGRCLRSWVADLRAYLGLGMSGRDEARLVRSAWLLLDRDIRGPRPEGPVSGERFVAEWLGLWEAGAFDGVLGRPARQQTEDGAALRAVKNAWRARGYA